MVENTRQHVCVNIDRSIYKMFNDICKEECVIMSRKIESFLLGYIKEYDRKKEA